MDLGKVGSEFSLLELSRGNVLVRFDDFAPRQEPRDCFNRDFEALGLPPLFVPSQFSELRPLDRIAHLADLLGNFAGTDRLHEAAHGIKRSFGVVVSEVFVVRKLIAHIEKFRDVGALRMAQDRGKSFLPESHHSLEEALLVPSHLTDGIGA